MATTAGQENFHSSLPIFSFLSAIVLSIISITLMLELQKKGKGLNDAVPLQSILK